jgi:class 3 adenylate cyclase/tetratricopeptide (TPR) repeat protein
VEFRVLGPLEVHGEVNGVTPLHDPSERAVLLLLLLRANEVVPVDELAAMLWDGRPPASAAVDVDTYVSHLRRALAGLGEDRIAARHGGYTLRVEPDELDASRFERLIGEAQATEDPVQVLETLRTALMLWRGPPLEELSAGVARAEVARLEALRASALDDWFSLESRLGRADALPQVVTQDVRKTVTVLFCDLVESTQLWGPRDPEVARRVMARFFTTMRAALERHGGTIEKYIGDAIMAVFGVPVLHEDDALRAVHAAVEMRETLASLNDELERAFGIRLATRIGINTGEVIASRRSQRHLMVTGDAVTLAKRLEQAAGTDEILVGEATQLLIRDVADLERMDGLALKGSSISHAWRVRAVVAGESAVRRRFDAPLVNRTLELTLLRRAFSRAVAEGSGHFVTLLGPAGVGKSRLVNELVTDVEDALVLRGRCLPYGEGITYWPLAEILRTALGPAAQGPFEELVAVIAAQLPDDPNAPAIAERVAATLGGDGSAARAEETFWAIRKLVESIARRRPLVLVLEDLHWAEPTFLDLVEHLGDAHIGALLLLCIARPELVEQRPSWGGGKLNSTTILLEPLSESESRQLIANLLDGAPVAAEAEARITSAAEGNPLFTEELVAMLVDGDLLRREGDRWVAAADLPTRTVPLSIHTLLSARIEQLPDDERAILRCAAVEGTVFHRGAVAALAPELPRAEIERLLGALLRKDVIRPAGSSFAGDDAYRFRHVLMQDAAYRSLSKRLRADLHERFVTWLERTAGGRHREFEEIVGYHLEQAYRSRVDLGTADVAALAESASARLESAGRRALARSDLPAAIGLLERAAALKPDGDERAALLVEVAAARIEVGELKKVRPVLSEAMRMARAGDRCVGSRVLVQRHFLRLLEAEPRAAEKAARTVRRLVPVFERGGDDSGLSSAWRLQAWLCWNDARAGAAAEAWERAASHARRAGDERSRAEILTWIASSLYFGPTPVVDAIRRCEEIRDEVSGDLVWEALTLRHLGGLHAMEGRLDVARGLLATSNAVFDDLGPTLNAAASHTEAVVELQAGEPAAAERSLRAGYATLERMDEKAFLSTTAAFLARAILAQGRDDEAREYARRSALLASSDDVFTQVLRRGVEARILARRGRGDEAVSMMREAVALADATDFVNHRGDALTDLAHVLRDSGRIDGARAAVAEAIRLFELKGNVVAAALAKRQLGDLTSV